MIKSTCSGLTTCGTRDSAASYVDDRKQSSISGYTSSVSDCSDKSWCGRSTQYGGLLTSYSGCPSFDVFRSLPLY